MTTSQPTPEAEDPNLLAFSVKNNNLRGLHCPFLMLIQQVQGLDPD